MIHFDIISFAIYLHTYVHAYMRLTVQEYRYYRTLKNNGDSRITDEFLITILAKKNKVTGRLGYCYYTFIHALVEILIF